MSNTTPIQYFDFQKLEVYRKGQRFHLLCKSLLRSQKLEKHVCDQILRSSHSIVLNTAEGCGRSTPADRKHFFTIARASIFECVAIMDMILEERKIAASDYNEYLKLCDEVSKMLYVMIRKLNS